MMLAGIRDILVISTPRDIDRFQDLLKDGSQLGLNITYKVQDKPNGLAEAFIVGADFIGDDSVCLILGDNIFYGSGLSKLVQRSAAKTSGATVFGYQVNDPERFGVVSFDDEHHVKSIVEKPEHPASNFAVTGMYFYDNQVVDIAKNLKPSPRGEDVELLGRGYAWLDTGTHESLHEAASFIETVQKRQNLKIACLEEVAYRMGYINRDQLRELAQPLKKNDYGQYILRLADEKA
uniref:sugar nucleotidyltransferase n=1 Tax=Lacticaseibacillus paracasei TaxID=1597 RepID=UPI0022E2DC23